MMTNNAFLEQASLLITEIRLYWLVALLYGVCFCTAVAYFITRKNILGESLNLFLAGTAVIHIPLILFRTYLVQRFPLQSIYEALSLFALLTTVTYLYISRKWRNIYLIGLMVSAIAFTACLYALLNRSPVAEPIMPTHNSIWFEIHVIAGLLAYAAFAVSFSIESLCVMIKFAPERYRSIFGFTGEVPCGWSYRLSLYGFPFLTLSLITGGLWAYDLWGVYWSWDPKQTWALITWMVFAVYLHAKSSEKWKGLTASLLNISGFVSMMVTFVGVDVLINFLLTIKTCHWSH
ncbi:MAG: cytochrome c biogenesis protein CcsA [Nitrospirae bacterium]|nr:cytochrome c biogenesis protein CcsA [Nitrospirota bacterium]